MSSSGVVLDSVVLKQSQVQILKRVKQLHFKEFSKHVTTSKQGEQHHILQLQYVSSIACCIIYYIYYIYNYLFLFNFLNK